MNTLGTFTCACGTAFAVSIKYMAGRRFSRRCRSCINRKSATKHGGKGTATYKTWKNMRTRCRRHPHYVKMGITVCPRWDSFPAFLQDIGERPSSRHSLDRIDGTGNYEPGNVRWATQEQQCNNQSKNVWIAAFGERKTMAQWTRDPRSRVGISCLSRRLDSGWSAEVAISKPSRVRPCTVTTP